MCRLLIFELEKRNGKLNFVVLYIGRYIRYVWTSHDTKLQLSFCRLTSSYVVIIAFYCTFFLHIDDGPLWNSTISKERDRCVKSWWSNVLYVNNYVNTEYLVSDNHCHFVPLSFAVAVHVSILVLGCRHPTILSCPSHHIPVMEVQVRWESIVGFGNNYINRYSWSWNIQEQFGSDVHDIPRVISEHIVIKLCSVFVIHREVSDLNSNSYFKNVYIKTHVRASSYCIGLVFGYVAHKLHDSRYCYVGRGESILMTCFRTNLRKKVPTYIFYFGWIVVLSSAVMSMFSVVVFYQPQHEYNNLEAAVYSALHRVAWCVAVGWVVTNCVLGKAGKVCHP